jgi:hypothetical protein
MQLDVDEESTPPHTPLKKKGEITINEPCFFLDSNREKILIRFTRLN